MRAVTSLGVGLGSATTLVGILLLGGCSNGGSVPARPSFGCEANTLAPGDTTVTITSGSMSRTYNLHVPPTYDATKAVPLVLNFHGFTSDPTQQALFSDMNTKADAEGFIVAYPTGISNSFNAGACCGVAKDNDIDDVGFARDIVHDITTNGCIDQNRVYATGMSNGGFMTHRLACEASDVFAAFAPVAGVLGIPDTDCNPTRPVPIMQFHGTADPLVPYDGSALLGFQSVPDTMQGWVDRDGCDPKPKQTFQNGAAHCDTWSGCDSGVEVTLCTIDGMGHCWPGSQLGVTICPALNLGPGSLDISANDQMWDFFQRFPMR